MRCQIIAELASNHGGDLNLLDEMIRAAADCGADWVKIQSYQTKHLSPSDPQYAWLKQAELTDAEHDQVQRICALCGVQALTTVFHPDDLDRINRLGMWRYKIGGGEAARSWWRGHLKCPSFISWPWGRQDWETGAAALSVVPLYPTPPSALAGVKPLDGWSDHCEGLDIAKLMVARGAKYIEKHFSLPGKGRNQAWDMTPDDLEELRRWTEVCATATDGTPYGERWTR